MKLDVSKDNQFRPENDQIFCHVIFLLVQHTKKAKKLKQIMTGHFLT